MNSKLCFYRKNSLKIVASIQRLNDIPKYSNQFLRRKALRCILTLLINYLTNTFLKTKLEIELADMGYI